MFSIEEKTYIATIKLVDRIEEKPYIKGEYREVN